MNTIEKLKPGYLYQVRKKASEDGMGYDPAHAGWVKFSEEHYQVYEETREVVSHVGLYLSEVLIKNFDITFHKFFMGSCGLAIIDSRYHEYVLVNT